MLGAHSHQFGPTFAVDLLTHGVSMEHVSTLLGRRVLKITQHTSDAFTPNGRMRWSGGAFRMVTLRVTWSFLRPERKGGVLGWGRLQHRLIVQGYGSEGNGFRSLEKSLNREPSGPDKAPW